VMMRTARDTLKDKLNGFAVGTDDYLVKPFDLSELLVRVQAMIKRSRGEVAHVRWQVADLILNTADQTVTRAGQAIELAPIQFKLLALLMRQSPQVVNRQAMMIELWGEEEPESDALRSHIYNLRKQIDKPFAHKLLHTVSGIGLKVAADIMTNDETALES
ncbi:response regulator transcription factor, partial [Rhizobium hidalgonense]